MNTFEDAVRAARDAKASIAALAQAEDKPRANLAALRAAFAREEQALIDAIAKAQADAAEARAALQAALQRINDAPIEDQPAAMPFDAGDPATYPNQGALIGAEIASGQYVGIAGDLRAGEEAEPSDFPGLEPLKEEAGRAATGFAY
jgi:hypothetical protein